MAKFKPKAELIGADGNIFTLMGIASRALKEHGMLSEAKEMCEKVTQSKSYHEALGVLGDYVRIASIDEFDDDSDFDEDYENYDDDEEYCDNEGGIELQ